MQSPFTSRDRRPPMPDYQYPYQQPGFRHPDGHKYTDAEKLALSNNLTIGGAVFLSVVAPILLGLAMMPFWDEIGDWKVVTYINDIFAPAIGRLPALHQHALTQRRFLIGASALLYSFFLAQFFFVLFSRKRRFFYLESYDLTKNKWRFYIIFLICWIILAVVWYLIFFDENWIRHAGSAPGRMVLLFPVLTLILGQMSTFAFLGIARDVVHLPRVIRRLFYR